MPSPVPATTISTSLQKDLNRLRQLNTKDIQTQWHWHNQDINTARLFSTQMPSSWPIAPLNERQHIAWNKGLSIRWLHQTINVPTDLHGYPLTGLILRIALTWWADDAQIYVDDVLVQSGDLFECFTRLCLSNSVKPGDRFQVAIRLVSPDHDDGALVRSQLIYELPSDQPTPEPSFVADELTVLATLEPTTQPKVEAALNQLDWDSLTDDTPSEAFKLWSDSSDQGLSAIAATHPFQQSLSLVRRTLRPLCNHLKKRTISCIGHAHLDMAWLWPIADTWEAAERTFKSVIELQEDFPNLTYTHSSPALFEWLEKNRPALFKQIQQKVAEGSWSIDAGLWIEPEFNIISGEAIARHILYGQRYCQEKFGHISKVAWLPDSFGFCWQLPQLLTQGGIETFATLKLSWNDTTAFPHQLFWWESPDGSRILSLMLPPIGTDIDPIKMTEHAKQWENSTHNQDSLWLPGLGDHGGGPTRDMLEKAERWEKSPFFPTLKFTTPNSYIKNLPLATQNIRDTQHIDVSRDLDTSNIALADLPVWKNELYLELHRGCYTSHADQKQQNRQSEDLLYQAEVFATIANIIARQPYPKTEIETAWKTLLFNQFHDILPGTSIPEVFIEANQSWALVKKIGEQVLEKSLQSIAQNIFLPTPPSSNARTIIVFNSLSWPRSKTISIKVPLNEANKTTSTWTVYDYKQEQIPHQLNSTDSDGTTQQHILFTAHDIPAVGYQCFWLCSQPIASTQANQTNLNNNLIQTIEQSSPKLHILENRFIQVSISSSTGQIASLIEKSTQTESLKSAGNQLQVFCDQGEYWDAWNIAADYTNNPLPAPILKSVKLIESGPIRQRLRTVHQFNNSTISQDYVLTVDSPFLTIENSINWQESQTLLKSNFPVNLSANYTTSEIPFGTITHTTVPKTAADKAKWEIPALRWADTGNSDFGISILTNSKHGFDAGANYLRLTLLKSPIWPDSQSDKGWHHFSYAIYPHIGNWKAARTTHYAKELNIQPLVSNYTAPASKISQKSEPTRSFLRIHNPNVILSALKPSEDSSHEFILRCYEAHGITTTTHINNTLGLEDIKLSTPVNLLEVSMSKKVSNQINAHQIQTYSIKLSQSSKL